MSITPVRETDFIAEATAARINHTMYIMHECEVHLPSLCANAPANRCHNEVRYGT